MLENAYINAQGADGLEMGEDYSSRNNSSRLFFNSNTANGNWSVFNNSGSLIFKSGAAAGSTSGNYTALSLTTSDVSIGGNLVVGNGNGIDFSATGNGSGTMTSELLDDYEEGTWTPTLYGHTTAGTTSGTLTGKYTKIGREVFATVQFAAVSLSSAGGRLYMGGLPYTAVSGAAGGGLATYMEGFNPTYFYNVDSDSNAFTFVVVGSGTEGVFRPSVTQLWDNFVNAATSTWNSGGGSVYGSLQFTYMTS